MLYLFFVDANGGAFGDVAGGENNTLDDINDDDDGWCSWRCCCFPGSNRGWAWNGRAREPLRASAGRYPDAGAAGAGAR